MKNRKLEMAHFYAEKMGWSVIPIYEPIKFTEVPTCTCSKGSQCTSIGKHPRTNNGLKDASTKTEQINDWWKTWPDANIGILTGYKSNIFALDIDPRHGGETSLDELITSQGKLPDTVQAITGGGGLHFIFEYPKDCVIGNRTNLFPGIDIKGENGYIIVEPSLHRSDQEYYWELSLYPGETKISKSPRWLLDMISKREPKKSIDQHIDNSVIAEGQRNSRLASMAGCMRNSGFSQEEITTALLKHNTKNCNPPLTDIEVINIAKSISKYSPKTKTIRPKMKDEAFNGPLGQIAEFLARNSEASKEALFMTLLTAIGNNIGHNAFCLIQGQPHYPNLYTCLVGESAKARKGTTWSVSRMLVNELFPEWDKEHVQSGLSSGEGIIDYLNVSVDNDQLDSVDYRLSIYESEFGSVLANINRSGNILSAVLRNAWDGIPLSTLTKNNRAKVDKHHISCIFHITASELKEKLRSVEMFNGLANRILWIHTERGQILPFCDAINLGLIETEISLIRSNFNKLSNTRIELSANAREQWAEIYYKIAYAPVSEIDAIVGRAEAQIRRIALILSAIEGSVSTTALQLQSAKAIWDYCEESAHYIFGKQLINSKEDKILSLISNSEDGLSRTEINNAFSNHLKSDELDFHTGNLIGKGLIESEEIGTDGRNSIRYRIANKAKKAS